MLCDIINNFFIEKPRYKYVENLGKGSTSTVNKYHDSHTEKYVAVKSVKIPSKNRYYQEVNILRILNGHHPAFLEFYESNQESDTLNIITEVVEGDELYDIIVKKPLSEDEAKKIFYQLADAIRVTHSKNIIHRDLKPEHIFVHNGKIKIIDWGYASILDQMYTNSCGSIYYVAPEILITPSTIDFGNDVWALGIILFAMITGKLLMNADNTKDLFSKIRRRDYDLGKVELSVDVTNLLNKMLAPLGERITCDEILKDKWFSCV